MNILKNPIIAISWAITYLHMKHEEVNKDNSVYDSFLILGL